MKGFNQGLDYASYHANVSAYSSARWDQSALEHEDLDLKPGLAKGHGLFTYAVVAGLIGKGDLDGDKQIKTRELHDFVPVPGRGTSV